MDEGLAAGWLARLHEHDASLLLAVNGSGTPTLDPFFAFLSGPLPWILAYGLVLLALLRRRSWLAVASGVGALGLVAFLADSGAVHLFKHNFARMRPCYQPELEPLLRIGPEGCGGDFGFVSAHAANAFALATFSVLMFRRLRWLWLPAFAAALLSALGRVYEGVHFPADVLFGGLYGAACALLVAWALWRTVGGSEACPLQPTSQHRPPAPDGPPEASSATLP